MCYFYPALQCRHNLLKVSLSLLSHFQGTSNDDLNGTFKKNRHSQSNMSTRLQGAGLKPGKDTSEQLFMYELQSLCDIRAKTPNRSCHKLKWKYMLKTKHVVNPYKKLPWQRELISRCLHEVLKLFQFLSNRGISFFQTTSLDEWD